MPVRIQRKRTKGWKMPENTVYVGRPTKWGNPYVVGGGGGGKNMFVSVPGNATEAVRLYRETINKLVAISPTAIAELRGKNLACWCPLDQPCHADVLLELANRE